jgi:hypothetical protein
VLVARIDLVGGEGSAVLAARIGLIGGEGLHEVFLLTFVSTVDKHTSVD